LGLIQTEIFSRVSFSPYLLYFLRTGDVSTYEIFPKNAIQQGILVIFHYNLDIKLIKFVSYLLFKLLLLFLFIYFKSDRKKESEISSRPTLEKKSLSFVFFYYFH
jgi:hypothetical protein